MTKRGADIQLTKDMSDGFMPGAGDDSGMQQTPPMATSQQMAGRKIAPLKRRGRGGAAGSGSRTPGANLPNVFANLGQSPAFGAGAPSANGTPTAQSSQQSSFFGAQSAGPTTPTGFGSGSSGFTFSQPQQPEQPKSNLFGTTASATNGTPGGMFGNNAPAFGVAPPSTNGMFGGMNGSGATSTAPSFNFGATANNAPSPNPSTGFSFGFGDNKPAASAGGSIFGNNATSDASKPFTFGMPPDKPAEPNPPASFSFGQSAASSAPPAFSAPATASAPPANDPKPAFSFGQTSAPAAPQVGGSLFGKPTETTAAAQPLATSLFGKPTPSPEPSAQTTQTSSLFGQNKLTETSAPPSLFSKPVEKAPAFGFGAPVADREKAAPTSAAEPSKSLFDAPTDKKADATPSLFGAAPNASGTPKLDPKPPLFSAPPVGGLFGQPAEKPAEKSAPSTSVFGQPTTQKTTEEMATNAPSFGFKPSEPKPEAPKTTAPPTFGFGAPKTQTPAPASSSSASQSSSTPTRKPSPPLPAESNSWSSNQLTEYYNLFALRSLNHFFREELGKVDVFVDYTPLCEAYMKEAAKIRDLINRNQRYQFNDAPPASLIPGKRSSDDSDDRSGKRRAFGEGLDKNASQSGKSNSSQALASILGDKSSGSQKLAEKPAFDFKPPSQSGPKSDGFQFATKPAFGFAPPGDKGKEKEKPKGHESVLNTPSPADSSSWVNPFQKVDTSNLPDDNFDMGDDEATEDKTETTPNPSGGLFDRITSPPKDNPPNAAKSIFSAGGDQTWSPDKGFKFSASGGTAASSLFGNNSSASTPFSFSPKPASTAAPSPSATADTSEAATPAADGEPSDAVPAKAELDLSRQGPGEEDEDSMFEARSIVYRFAGTTEKMGVGLLRVLKNQKNNKGRIIVRTDGGKVLLNVALIKAVDYNIRDGRCLLIPEFLAEGGRTLWGAKVSKNDICESLRQAVTTVKNAVPSS